MLKGKTVKDVGVRDRIRKIKDSKIWKLSDDEKVGVVNGLVLLGAVSGALLSLHEVKEVHADSSPECDANSGEVIKSGIESHDFGLDTSEWGNHCWWDHSWSDWSDWSDWSNVST